MMKKIIPLFTTLLLGWSMNAWSFACKTATRQQVGGVFSDHHHGKPVRH